MFSADQILKFDSKLKNVEVKKSLIKDAGLGLYTRKQFQRNQPVVVYYGMKLSTDDVYDKYTNNPIEYKEMNKVIRGTPNGYSIIGMYTDIPNLQGVYVNDISTLKLYFNDYDKNNHDHNKKMLEDYAKTIIKCNLKTIDTSDYPVYYTSKSVKKGEELYAHYGIGYWLMANGFPPEEISHLNNLYNFEYFYQ